MHSQFIEVGIGLIFVFLLMAIMVSAANEVWMQFKMGRGRFLKKVIAQAIDDPKNKNWSLLVYDHPLIDTLKHSERRPPAYISASTFAMALTDVISNEARKDQFKVNGDSIELLLNENQILPFDQFCAGLNTLKESDFKKLMQTLVQNSNRDFDQLKTQIENWFNEYMDRVSGWYKNASKKYIFRISLVLTILMNVDTIDLSVQLWKNAVLRESVVNTAEMYAKDYGKEIIEPMPGERKEQIIDSLSKDSTKTIDDINAYVDSVESIGQRYQEVRHQVTRIKDAYNEFGMLDLPIGWDEQNSRFDELKKEYRETRAAIDANTEYSTFKKWRKRNAERFCYWWSVFWLYLCECTLLKLFGWLFTATAVSFGAPYWFDMLNKLINLRSTGKSARSAVKAGAAK